MERFEVGQKIDTTVVAISGDTVFIDLGLKSEGMIAKAEFTDRDGNVSVKEGDKISVFFLGEKRGEMQFTTRLAGENADTSVLETAWKSGLPVEGKVEKEIKGGFEVLIGTTRAFCPYSQMGYRQKAEAAEFIGKHLTFLVSEYKNEGKSIVVSNRAILEIEEKKHLANLEKEIVAGKIVTGKITALKDYGAFVDIGGFQALLPISEIAHRRIENIESVLSVGQEIEAKVIKADWLNEKVSLSMKALEKDPWDDVAKTFPVGTKIDGTISRVAPFGVFVTLAPAIDGLVHISELDVEKNTNLSKVFTVGDTFSVVVTGVLPSEHRISLKPASSVEQDKEAEDFLDNQSSSSYDTYNPFAAYFSKKAKK